MKKEKKLDQDRFILATLVFAVFSPNAIGFAVTSLIKFIFKLIEALVHYAAAIISFVIFASLIGLTMAVARIFNSKMLREVAHGFVYILSALQLWTLGYETTVIGTVWDKETSTIMANHVSWVDMYALAYSFRGKPTTAVSKWQNFWIPLFGQVIWSLYVISIRRGGEDKEGDKRKMREIGKKCIRLFLNLLIFPEGTRSKTGIMDEFKWGAFLRAKESGMPIIPIVTKGLFHPKSFFITKKKITVTIGEKINPADYTVADLREHTHQVMTQMAAA